MAAWTRARINSSREENAIRELSIGELEICFFEIIYLKFKLELIFITHYKHNNTTQTYPNKRQRGINLKTQCQKSTL